MMLLAISTVMFGRWDWHLRSKMRSRSGDLYLPQSKQHVSFWNLMLSDTAWQALESSASIELQLPEKEDVKETLTQQFEEDVNTAKEKFDTDGFAQIQDKNSN
ncbi:MAG: hypothetical protein M5U34_44845 [Chloroflexi bacterium]|nr:hypothetical protein [Chloroflexota bacterium]